MIELTKKDTRGFLVALKKKKRKQGTQNINVKGEASESPQAVKPVPHDRWGKGGVEPSPAMHQKGERGTLGSNRIGDLSDGTRKRSRADPEKKDT